MSPSATKTNEAVKAIYDWQAQNMERIAGALAHWIKTTNPAKLDWCPELKGKGRSAYAQVFECAGVNRRFAAILKGQTSAPGPETHNYASPDQAAEDLIVSAKDLASTVRSLDEEALTRKYNSPFGEVPGAVMISVPMFNMNYHAGQVNFIQLLDGDAEFHIPPNFV